MYICIKKDSEIKKIKEAGKIAASVLDLLDKYIEPGITTNELDLIAHKHIIKHKAVAAPLGYRGFPKSICTSINQVVCHGIPSERRLQSGDIINVDVTVIKNGYHGDTSKMYCVGSVSELAKNLIEISQECLYKGISSVKPGKKLGEIGSVIATYARENKYSVVEEYCGHGIGREFHEEGIQVLHYGNSSEGIIMKPGMTFTIEPMINAGRKHVLLLNDKWTVVTRDRSLSAQWEHTVSVTESGCEILTIRQGELEKITSFY